MASKIDNPTQGKQQIAFWGHKTDVPTWMERGVEICETGKFHRRGVVKTRKNVFLTREVLKQQLKAILQKMEHRNDSKNVGHNT